jgi:Flp pilus assembly pilin Flp
LFHNEQELKPMANMLMRRLRAVIRDERGLETLEYAVFAAAFLVIIAGAVALLSTDIATAYSDIGNFIQTQAGNM